MSGSIYVGGTDGASNGNAQGGLGGAGTLSLSGSGNRLTSAGLVLTNKGTIEFRQTDTFVVDSSTGAISGAGVIRQTGTGTTRITTANTYSGGTTLSNGTLEVTHNNALGSGSLTQSGGTLSLDDGISLSNAIVIDGVNQQKIHTDGTGALTGVISGSGILNKTGAGTLTLSRNNTYSGGTTLSSGTLEVAHANALGSGSLTQSGGTTLSLADGISLSNAIRLSGTGEKTIQTTRLNSITGVISGSGSLIKTGVGILSLSGDNTYSGGTTLSSGTLEVTHANALGSGSFTHAGVELRIADGLNLSNAIELSGTYARNIRTNGTSALTGVISGTGTLLKAGAGTLTLSGDNTYSGGTSFSSGTLVIAHANALGSGVISHYDDGTLSLADGISLSNAIRLSGTYRRNISTSGTSALTGVISGTGTLSKIGSGTLTLSGNNTYSGGTILSSGTLVVAHANALGSGALTQSGGTTLSLADRISLSNAIVLDGTDEKTIYTYGTGALSGVISGTGPLIKTGPGTLTLSGNNTYSGGTTLSSGTLVVAHENALGSGSFTQSGGRLRLDDGISLSKAIVLAGPGQRVIYTDGESALTGVISGTGTLFKIGTGTLTLSGDNTYSGGTTLDEGTLEVAHRNALGSGSFTQSGGTLSLDEGISLSNAIVLNGAYQQKIHTEGTSALTGVISGTGYFTKTGAGTLTLSGNNTYSGRTILSTGTLVVAHANALGSGLFRHSGGTLSLDEGISLSKAIELDWAAARTIHTDGTGALTGVISGTGTLFKTGAGTLTLSGINTYSGGTTIDEGTLAIGSGSAIGAGSLTGKGGTLQTTADITLNNNVVLNAPDSGSAAFAFSPDASTTLSLTGVISGTGELVKTGAGTLVVTGANTYSGGTTVDAGTLVLTGGGTPGSGTVTVNGTLDLAAATAATFTLGNLQGAGRVVLGDRSLIVSSTVNSAFNGIVTGSGSVTKTGAGTLTLSGANEHTGGTNVNEGTLVVTQTGALGTGPVAVNAGATLTTDAALNLGSATLTVDGGTVNGSGSITASDFVLTEGTITASLNASTADAVHKVGTGTLTLGAQNNFAGGMILDAGTVVATHAGALGTGTVLVNAGATLTADTAVTGLAGLTLDGGVINGTGTITTGAFNLISGTVNIDIVATGASAISLDTGKTLEANGVMSGFSTVTLNGGELFGTGAIDGAQIDGRSGQISANITGSGAVSKTTSGTLTLSGQNTYTGGTNILAGTLVAAHADALGSGPVDLTGGTLTLDAAVTTAGVLTLGSGTLNGTGSLTASSFDLKSGNVSAALTGAGALNKTTSGTVTLSGQNTYTGGTNILAGTLVAAHADALGSGPVDLTGGTLTLDAAVTTAGALTLGSGTLNGTGSFTASSFDLEAGNVSAALTGAGALNKTTSGTVTLSGQNTYTGGTNILEGTLALVDGGTLLSTGAVNNRGVFDIAGITGTGATVGHLSGTGAIVLGGKALTFGTGGDATLVGVISGTGGSLVIQGAGTVTLSGENTYTGGTTVATGALIVAHAQALGTGAVIVNGTGITADFSGDATWANAISGTGDFSHDGAGTLTLTGSNSLTGTTRVNAGTLVVGIGALSQGAYTAASGASVRIEGHSGTLANDLGGAGDYALSGSGTTTLGRDMTGTGTFTVGAGRTLNLGGTDAAFAEIRLLSGATLSGSGSIRSLYNDGGTIAAGNSPGTITVSTDFVSTGGTLELEIAGTGAGDYDRYTFSGVSRVNETTVNVSFLNGFVAAVGDTVDFLEYVGAPTTASVFEGTGFVLGTLPVLPAGTGVRLVQMDDRLQLEFYRNSLRTFAGLAPHTGLDAFIDAVVDNTAAFDALAAIGNGAGGGAALSHAVTAASPIGFSAMDALVIDESRRTADFVRARAQNTGAANGSEWTAFVTAHGALTDWNDGQNRGTFDQSVFGGKAGLEKRVAQDLSVGLAAGYDRGKGTLHRGAGRIDQDRGSITAYLAYDFGGDTFAYTGVTGGYSSFDTRRDTALGREKGGTHGTDLGLVAGVGHRFALGETFEFTPYAAINYTVARTDGFTESGDAFAVKVNARTTESLRFKVGQDLAMKIPTAIGGLRVALGVAFEHEALDADTAIHAAFTNGSGAFGVRGKTLSRNMIGVGPSIGWSIDDAQSVSAGYTYEYGFAGSHTNRFDAAYTVKF